MSASSTDVDDVPVAEIVDSSPLESIYLFDDLTGLLPSLPLDAATVRSLTGRVRQSLFDVVGLVELDRIAVEVFSWEHALAEFLARTPALPPHDVAIVLGAGGARFARQLEDRGLALAGRLDVPAAKILSDSGNAFFSEHHVLQRDGSPLAVDASAALAEGARILVVDDCVQTGGTLAAVAEAAGVRSGAVATLVCNEFTRRRREDDGWSIAYGTLLPGETYPMSYATDLFCVRDFVVPTAVRFADGTSTSYSSGGDWLAYLHGERAEEARAIWQGLTEAFAAAGVLEEL